MLDIAEQIINQLSIKLI